MTLWVLFGVMSLVAVGFLVWPLYRHQKTLSPLIGVSVILIVALSTGLYYRQGNPTLSSADSGGAGQASMDEAIEGLAARLEQNPDDPNGWKMLGRSYMSIGDFPAAVEAYQKAIELESAQDPQALVGLGEALIASANGEMDSRAATLFENALALDPDYPQALFYGGLGAFNRDDVELAADRWERLLALNPPPEIQEILRVRVAEWRGEEAMPSDHPPMPSAAAEENTTESTESATLQPMGADAVVRANLSLTDEARANLPADATVFVIARDPAQPVPPIAVARRRLSELPTAVELGDRESMVPGRNLSGFEEIELIARVSLSGQPTAQPGDWYGAIVVKPADESDVALAIAERVN